MLACLLVTACSGTSNETARVNPNKASEKETTPTAEPATPEADPLSAIDRFAANKASYDSAIQEFMTAYRAANEEERKSLSDEYPKAEKYAEEFMKLASEYPDSEVAFDSLHWVVTNVRTGEVAKKAYDNLFANHLNDEALKTICMGLSYSTPGPQVESRLNLLMEKSPHDSVKASAIFALASYLHRLESTRQYLADNPDVDGFDEEAITYLNEREVEPMAIEALYQTLISDYPKLKPREGSKRTYQSMAESALFEMHSLAVGKVVPEIEGDDLDGVSFKLSDYRGKVVVLDFWGDW